MQSQGRQRAKRGAAADRLQRGVDGGDRLALERTVPDELVVAVDLSHAGVSREGRDVEWIVGDLVELEEAGGRRSAPQHRSGEHETGQHLSVQLRVARADHPAHGMTDEDER